MHPLRNFSRPALDLMDEDEIKAVKKRRKTRKQRLQTANKVFRFSRSDGFEILVNDVKDEITKLQDKILADKSISGATLKTMQTEAHCWKKVLKKLNGYLQQKDLIQKAMKRDAQSNI